MGICHTNGILSLTTALEREKEEHGAGHHFKEFVTELQNKKPTLNTKFPARHNGLDSARRDLCGRESQGGGPLLEGRIWRWTGSIRMER